MKDQGKYAKDRGALMWNIATDPRHSIGNNKKFTPKMDVKFPFPVASDNEQLEEDIVEFNQEAYDNKLNVFHEKMGLVFNGQASEKLAEEIIKNISYK